MLRSSYFGLGIAFVLVKLSSKLIRQLRVIGSAEQCFSVSVFEVITKLAVYQIWRSFVISARRSTDRPSVARPERVSGTPFPFSADLKN